MSCQKKCGLIVLPRICLIVFGFITIVLSQDIFETPNVLKDNVEFWKKIYTETSLKEGFLHDAEYPMIIYKKVIAASDAGEERNRLIKEERAKVEGLLLAIQTKPESAWSAEEQAIVELFKHYASVDAISTALERLRFQQGQKERFLEGLYRSGAYLDTIRSIFAEYGIPQRICFLPHVESSFNAYAYSKVGAAGLWQFMRSTGKIFMKIDYLVDERRDPVIATRAAARLLQQNYQQLQSWPLAITAYNHGVNGMKRAVASTGSTDIGVIIERHKSRSFQFASKNFYGCFLAASEIATAPEKFFGPVSYAPRLRYNVITLDNFMRPRDVARALGIDENELCRLNPAIRPVVFEHQQAIPRGTTLHIPTEISSPAAMLALGAVPDSLKSATPVQAGYYQVKRGETVTQIARQLGVSAPELAAANDLNRAHKIFAGQVLRIPAASAPRLASSSTIPATTRVAPAQPKAPPQVVIVEKSITVKASDTARPTAKQAVDTLAAILSAKADTLPQIVRSGLGRQQFDAALYNLDATIQNYGNTAHITVSIDETIGHYAEWLGIPTYRIRQLNSMSGNSSIRIGQRLAIPGDGALIAAFSQRRLEYHLALEEDFYGQYKVVDVKAHPLVRGETLWDICNGEDSMPLWLLHKYNKQIDLGNLMPGTTIWLPIIAEKTKGDFVEQPDGGIYPYLYEEPFLHKKQLRRIP
jgi:membrane-bound lytic murein transglycosylase D